MITIIRKTAKRIEKEFGKPTFFLVLGTLLSCYLVIRGINPLISFFDSDGVLFWVIILGLFLLIIYIIYVCFLIIVPLGVILILITIDRILIHKKLVSLKNLNIIEGVLLLIAWIIMIENYELREAIFKLYFD